MWNAVNLALEKQVSQSVCGGLCTITAGEFADFLHLDIAHRRTTECAVLASSRRRPGHHGVGHRRR